MDLPRQPKPVKIIFTGDPIDIEFYLRKIKRLIQRDSYDHVIRISPSILAIIPAAVSD